MNAYPPQLRSFLPVAPDSHFSIQNLPYGIFSRTNEPPRVGVAIGEWILDLAALAGRGLLVEDSVDRRVFAEATLNAFMDQGPAAWRAVRQRVRELLSHGCPILRDDAALQAKVLVPMADAALHLPVAVGGYTDFYSSREHATNVGRIFRDPDNALLPNWLHIPIAYNGRASSVVVSGTEVRRPNGQIKLPDSAGPIFGSCGKLDFELEIAFLVGRGNALGEAIPVERAEDHIFGLVLMNDWSARDIQQWEYVPLGPFNSKSFATSISPWVVPLEAVAPFRVAGPIQDPLPQPYLRQAGPQAFDIALEVSLRPPGAAEASLITRANAKYLYWSMAQQLAHHTVSGCNTRSGDLMGSGTISGPTQESCGSLLEITLNGQEPVRLAGNAIRTFLEDGDEVVMTGWCQGAGYRVGFGQVSGRILPAHRPSNG